MTLLEAAQLPVPALLGMIVLVYLACLGGVLAATIAWQGHPAYWLAVLGAFLFLLGALWGRGYLASGTTFTALGAGIALGVFGVALDLIVGPPFKPTQ